tara:strand:- start:1815 stop:2363 length:549 start_codon:yes stop_codon:yes gene_type:complete
MTTQNPTTPVFFDADQVECDLASTTLAEAVAEVEDYLRASAYPQEWCYDQETESYRSQRMETTVYRRCSCASAEAPRGDDDCELCFGEGYDTAAGADVIVVIEPQQPIEDESAPDAFAVVRTSFHNGGIVSLWKTEKGAQWAIWNDFGQSECTCGCGVVVPVEELDALKPAIDTRGAYSPAL